MFPSHDQEWLLKATRQINASALPHYFRGRFLFGSLTDFLVSNSKRFPFFVGEHVFKEFGTRLKPFLDGETRVSDQHGQDYGFHPVVHYEIYRSWTRIMQQPWTVLHDLFVFDEIFSLISVNDRIVRKEKGNPSGSPSTLYMNCFHNLYCLTSACRKAGMSYSEWYDAVFVRREVLICGDDSLIKADLCSEMDLHLAHMEIGALISTSSEPFDNISFCNAVPEVVRLNGVDHIVRVPADCNKLIASVVYKSTGEAYKTLSQLCSMRLQTLFSPYFDIFDDLAHWYVSQHDSVLSGDPDWESAKKSLLDKKSLMRIHLNLEKRVCCNHSPFKNPPGS
jgi:hypothetical protein